MESQESSYFDKIISILIKFIKEEHKELMRSAFGALGEMLIFKEQKSMSTDIDLSKECFSLIYKELEKKRDDIS